ncbi:cytochrome P450 [Mycena latifolia]|nr:cytochrome P450 [Mycena latifolia]
MILLSSSLWSIFGLVLLYYSIRWQRNRSRLPLPPGPKKLPLVGNLFDMPAERQWETYHKWSKQFNSDIIQLDVGGTSIVVLSSLEAVRDLFDKRSALYSDRPRLPMLVELMGWDWAIGFMKYGTPHQRAHRKMFHEAFSMGAAKQFQLQERLAAHALLRRILKDPKDVMQHFRHMAGALIMDVTYGIDVNSSPQYLDLAEEAMYGLSIASLPGRFLVDTFPVLKYVPSWVPGADFQRKAKQWRTATRKLLESPFAQTKREFVLGIAPHSFTSLSLAALDDTKDAEKLEYEALVKATAANMYAAGADTTVAALGTFILAMLANPDAQAKAQAELDSVIGPGHLPDFTDEPALPYLSAVVKEVLRWQNVTPIALPHYLTVDDEYRGYRIPAGSLVIGNGWFCLKSCSNSPQEIYPDPHTFKPERFLRDGKLNPAVRDPDTAAFGFGRRICPGRHMVWASLWITIGSILATLHINKARDESGKEIEPSYEYSPGTLSMPLPFKCSITPRSPQAAAVIRATGSKPE